jgi:hypothetical protein
MGLQSFFVFDGESQKVYKSLTREQVSQIRTQVPTEKRDVWFFWTTGLSRWLALEECDEKLTVSGVTNTDNVIHLGGRTSPNSPPPPPVIRGERRLHERYPLEMLVIAVSQDGRIYRTKSRNVSFGGLLIQGGLPPDLRDTFLKIYLSHPRFPEKVQVRGRWVPNEARGDQIAFVYWSQNERTVFETWLNTLAPGAVSRKKAA